MRDYRDYQGLLGASGPWSALLGCLGSTSLGSNGLYDRRGLYILVVVKIRGSLLGP